jgi:hypothetical protein
MQNIKCRIVFFQKIFLYILMFKYIEIVIYFNSKASDL